MAHYVTLTLMNVHPVHVSIIPHVKISLVHIFAIVETPVFMEKDVNSTMTSVSTIHVTTMEHVTTLWGHFLVNVHLE